MEHGLEGTNTHPKKIENTHTHTLFDEKERLGEK
jgi:hypothetical protein